VGPGLRRDDEGWDASCRAAWRRSEFAGGRGYRRSVESEEAFIATETELKLAARPADLPALRHALEKMARGSRPSRAKLVSVYYDTPDRKLQREKLSLRVRSKGRQFIQTVKSPPSESGNGLSRGEWEDAVASLEPDRAAPQSGKLLRTVAGDNLAPLFTTEIERTAIDLSPFPATRIEAAIDSGTIRAGENGAEERVSEVELELKGGEATALYDVALRLLDVAPLRLDFGSKAQRGYRLIAADISAPEAVHAKAPALDPAMRGDAALRQIGHASLRHLMANEPAALAGNSEAIHQMRVAARRLRAILSAFRKMLPAGQRRAISAELRWLANALGPARNFDVLAGTLLEPARETVADAAELEAFAEAAERQRQIAYAEAIAAIRSKRYTALVLRTLRWLDATGWSERAGSVALHRPLADIAPILMERSRHATLKRARKFSEQSAAQRHQLRIALKKLRYTAEAFAGLYPRDRAEEFEKRLKRLQDDLGEANDIHVGRDLVAALTYTSASGEAIARAGRNILRWHRERVEQQEPETRQHLKELRRAVPFWREEAAAPSDPQEASADAKSGQYQA